MNDRETLDKARELTDRLSDKFYLAVGQLRQAFDKAIDDLERAKIELTRGLDKYELREKEALESGELKDL